MKVILKNVSSKIQLEEIYEKVLKEDWHDLPENLQGEYGEYKLDISNDKRNIKVEVR
jgi:hypothetical protein